MNDNNKGTDGNQSKNDNIILTPNCRFHNLVANPKKQPKNNSSVQQLQEETPEKVTAINQSTEEKTSAQMFDTIHKHSLEDGLETPPKHIRGKMRRRKSTSTIRKTSMTYRYATSSTKNNGFIVPPVFPKTCSLYDSNFNGGAFVDYQEDKKLVEAIDIMRKRHSERKIDYQKNEHRQQNSTSNKTSEDIAELSDSGNSSLADGHSSPLSSPSFKTTVLSARKTHFSLSADSKSEHNIPLFDLEQKINYKQQKSNNAHDKNGPGARKNSRFLFFRQRAKSNLSKKSIDEIMEKENSKNSNILPDRSWTSGTTKGTSWRAKFLRSLSAGNPSLGGENERKGKFGEKGEKPSNQFGNLNREWEVVTVRELCRRLSLEDSLEPSEMPLPEGALQSQMLDEFMIRQIVDILPPRAEGYPWIQLYNSEKHGFSLTTLYRKMTEWNEDMAPVLLVVRDVSGHVFGSVASTALKPYDHYYGTGDSCLLFRFTGEYPHTRELRAFTWTGENQFFINATKEFLSFGAGGGHYGLWLDADLNHGRSQKCATFDNEPLAGGQEEDFVIQFVEVFGFSMS